jgi:hypothetical protein
MVTRGGGGLGGLFLLARLLGCTRVVWDRGWFHPQNGRWGWCRVDWCWDYRAWRHPQNSRTILLCGGDGSSRRLWGEHLVLLRTQTGSYQGAVDDLEGLEDFGRTLGWHGLSVDAVAVVFIQDENLCITTTGLEWKHPV